MQRTIPAIVIALLSLFSAFLYSRRDALSLFYTNRPGSLQYFNLLPKHQIRFTETLRNCEDVYMNDDEGSGWAILSCDAGRPAWNTVMGSFLDAKSHADTGLYIYRYAETPDAPPIKLSFLDFKGEEDFHPLGLDYDARSQKLFVVNHASSVSRLEVFRLFEQENAASHIQSVMHPLLNTPNSIAAISETELLVSNDHYFQMRYIGLFATLETYLSPPLANIVRVRLGDARQPGNGTITKLVSMPFPNGVVLLNTTHVAVSSSSTAAVRIYASSSGFSAELSDLVLVKTITVPFIPDNLSYGNGKLLIAGHSYGPSLVAVAANSARCIAAGETDRTGCDIRSPSSVAEWSEEYGLKLLYVGTEFSSSTTAVRDGKRGFGIIGGLYERGIMTWDENP